MLNVLGTPRVLGATTPVDLRGSLNQIYGLWAGKEGLSGSTFCLVQIEVVVAVCCVQ
jgi:hypothetical protein